MKFPHLTPLLPAMLCVLCAHGQNTAPQATPQTQNATPAGVGGAGAAQPNQQPGSRSPRGGAANGKSAARRASSQTRSVPPAPAANSSVAVIGGSQLSPNSASAEAAALPGVNMPHNALGIAAGAPIHVRLRQTLDSGHAHNGDAVQGVLAEGLGPLPSGAPVQLTVVAAAPAGDIGSGGVLSLQVTSINGQQVLSEVITAEGKQGGTLLPDDAPARGTEAVFTSDAAFTVPAA